MIHGFLDEGKIFNPAECVFFPHLCLAKGVEDAGGMGRGGFGGDVGLEGEGGGGYGLYHGGKLGGVCGGSRTIVCLCLFDSPFLEKLLYRWLLRYVLIFWECLPDGNNGMVVSCS